MAFFSDELEELYKVFKLSGNSSIPTISKKFNILIANKVAEGTIKTTRDFVEHIIYVNGIANRSSFVKYSIVPRNVVIQIVIDSLPEEMATAYYDYNHNLKEKLEELEKETL